MSKMNFDLTKKVVLVTGATRGIGRGIAEALGAEGAVVGVGYSGSNEKSESLAQEVATKITDLGGAARLLRMNLTKKDEIVSSVELLVKEFGRLDGLVNNAGMTVDQLVLRYKDEDWEKVINTNLRGAFWACQAAIRPMMKSGGGSIVNMSSVIGLMGNAGQVPYSVSKAGLLGMTKSLAREVGSRKIRVNAIAPGFIQTDMTEAMTQSQKQALLANVALGNLGQVGDIAAGTLFLLSPLSSYITGQVLSINGGLYM